MARRGFCDDLRERGDLYQLNSVKIGDAFWSSSLDGGTGRCWGSRAGRNHCALTGPRERGFKVLFNSGAA